jgi:hypothetical protein
MADTFSNDLRLRLQESGSNAGTWGTLLNGTITNIASALGQGSEAIPNASSHTITLADGTADEARSLYLKCTGGGQACTVTLGPNTISKVWIIDNATSYTLTFSQGSGANVAIAAGAVKVIATDGAGSGAAVVDTLDGLEGSLSTLAVTGTATAGSLLTTGAIASTAVDGTVVDRSGNTSRFVAGRSGGNYAGLEMHVAGASGVTKRFSIDYDSTTKLFAPNGTSEHLVVTSAGLVGIGTSNPLNKFVVAEGTNQHGIELAPGTTSYIQAYDRATSDYGDLKIDGQTIAFGTDNGTERMRIDSSGSVGIGTSSPNESLSVADSIVSGDLADSTTTVYRLEPADTNFTRQLTISDRVGATSGAGKGNAIIFSSKYTGDTQQGMAGIVGISESISGTQKGALAFLTRAHDENPTERMRLRSDGNLNLGDTSNNQIVFQMLSATDGANTIHFGDANSGNQMYNGYINYQHGSSPHLAIQVNNAERMRIDSVGAIFATGVRSSSSANNDLRYNTSNGEIYYQTSSERYKSNIADLEFDTSNLYNLRPVSFDDNETGERCFGLIAEDTFEQIPEAVVTRNIDGETVPDSIPYSMLSVLIINEMKKLKVENDSLKERIEALENT